MGVGGMPQPSYRLPRELSEFQRELYTHLIDWKRKHITAESGSYRGVEYDAMLPDSARGKLPHLYEPVRTLFRDHQRRFPFKTHKFADHMASSWQAACRRRSAVARRAMADTGICPKESEESSFPACEAGCSTPRRPSGRPGAQACVKR